MSLSRWQVAPLKVEYEGEGKQVFPHQLRDDELGPPKHPTTSRFSVGEFLDTIVRANNHRYEFTREGRGCTSWVRDQFYLFVQADLLPFGWEGEFESAISSAWVKNQPQGQWPVTYGRYLIGNEETSVRV